ncbi:MAG: glycosyltransferase family 4 protein [Ferruginibacter sp.]
MEVIYHGQTENCRDNNLTPVRLSANQLLIVGRLKKFKGHLLLLSALKYIKNDFPGIKLIIVGEGEEKNNLMRFVKDNALDEYVVFAGFSNDVRPYFKGSDVVVAPSLAEPFGLIVLEAYACSKPVVAFNVTAFNENIIDNETGCLITPYNIEELAKKIKYLLENKNIAEQFGANGNALIKHKFSLNNSIEKTIKFYHSLN